MLPPGTKIGDWVLRRPFPNNDDGTLFEAQSLLSKNHFAALRVLPATQLGRPIEECTAILNRLAQVDHPALAKVIASGSAQSGTSIFWVREFVDGEHIGQTLSKGPMKWFDACEVVHQLLQGIQHLHKQGIPHGNIKASNACIRPDGSARLLDCALCVDTEPRSLTEMGHRFGTMAYLPPEVFRGEPLDPFRGDVYAMGQLLCEMIRGVRLFPDSSTLSATQRQSRTLSMKLEAGPMEVGENTPEALQTLIRHATDPDPAQRTVSIEVFCRSLAEVLEAHKSEARAEEEFLDVSQTALPASSTTASSMRLVWGILAIGATAVGAWTLFGN
jgi:serine/threonine-protein kinase